MARRAFYSFHFAEDAWRASQVRNMGVLEGNVPVSDNDWETVKMGGDAAIERWIATQMDGRSCVVVLIGAQTAERKWVKHEIKKGWGDKRGVIGVRIHGLKNNGGYTATFGANPFDAFKIGKTSMSSIVPIYNPSGADSKAVYASINSNLDAWVEAGIAIRAKY